LTGEFANEPDRPRILARLQRRLASPSCRDEVCRPVESLR
jgi:hypothetical protein